MNDKKAKRLRRGARLVAGRLKWPRVAYQFNQRTRVIRVALQSERGAYLELKREAK